MHRFGRALLLQLLLLVSCHGAKRGAPIEITLAAAASLRVALPDLIAAFVREQPRTAVAPVYGASGDLKKRLLDGAPIDAVMFAAPEPVDQLIAAGRIAPESREIVAHNQLVFIAPKDVKVLQPCSLDHLGADDKIAIGNPQSVPAGAYAKRWLVAMGRWDDVQGHLVLAGDVSAVLAYVRRGEVMGGFVYATDIQGIDGVRLQPMPQGPRSEIVAGVVSDGANRDAAGRFVAFLVTPEAQRILRAHGFDTAP